MNIIPDLSLVLVQFVPFLVVIFGLKIILFDPMLAYLHERDVATKGVRHDAESLSTKAQEKVARYEAALEKARHQITDLRARKRAEANTEYQRIVAEARSRAEARVTGALAQLHQDAEVARRGLAATSDALAFDIAQQVLGRKLEG